MRLIQRWRDAGLPVNHLNLPRGGPRWRPGREAAIAAGLGALMALGQAPWGLWAVSVPALAALIWRVDLAATPRRAAWVAWFGGAGHFGLALSWIVQPFLVDAARDAWMAPFAVVLLAFGLALFWALAAALACRLAPRALGFALALTLAELLRGTVLTGFPWALIGHVWIGTPLDQAAAWIGPNGLTLMTTLAAALPVIWHRRGALAAAVLLGLVAAAGAARLAPALPADHAATLRLIQPNAAQAVKWEATRARAFLDLQLELTARAPVADLTIWPETAIPYLLEDYPEVARLITDASGGKPVALGIQRVEGARYWNSLRLLRGQGEVVQTYDKHHLVPFGEYIPYGDRLQDWFGIGAFAAQAGGGYSAGPGPRLLDLGPALGLALPLICYEAVFPQDLRAAPGRAGWILQVTNDAWFGQYSGPFQHLAQARLRAVEQGLPVLRTANTGVTAVIDARGRIRAQLAFGVPGALDTPLPAALPPTPYARWGDAPVLAALLVLLAALAARALRRRPVPAA